MIFNEPHKLGDIFEDFQDYIVEKHGALALNGRTTATVIIVGDDFQFCANLEDCDAYTQININPEEIKIECDGLPLPVTSSQINRRSRC